jgi:hypothetical protein
MKERKSTNMIEFQPKDLLLAAFPIVRLISQLPGTVIICPIETGGNRLAYASQYVCKLLGLEFELGPSFRVARDFGTDPKRDSTLLEEYILRLSAIRHNRLFPLLFENEINHYLNRLSSAAWINQKYMYSVKKLIDQICYRKVDMVGNTPIRYDIYGHVLRNMPWRIPHFFSSVIPSNNNITLLFVDDSISYGRVGYAVSVLRELLQPIKVLFYADSAPLEPYYLENQNFGKCAPNYWRRKENRLVEDIAFTDPRMLDSYTESFSDEESFQLQYLFKSISSDWMRVVNSERSAWFTPFKQPGPTDALALVSLYGRLPDQRLAFFKKCYPPDLLRTMFGNIDGKRADQWFFEQVSFLGEAPYPINSWVALLSCYRKIEDGLIHQWEKRRAMIFYNIFREVAEINIRNAEVKTRIDEYLLKPLDLSSGRLDTVSNSKSHEDTILYGMGHPLYEKE